MKTKILGITAIWAVIILGLIGCATSVPIKSVRAPTIDTNSVKKLAIRPFENKTGYGSPTYQQLTQYMTDLATQKIIGTGKFEIVSPNDPNADGVFYGELRSLGSQDSQSTSSTKDKSGNTVTVVTYRREVSVSFVYGILSKRTDMPIGNVTKQGSTSSSSRGDSSGLSGTLDLARKLADSLMRSLEQDIVPTIVSTNAKLMNETSNDKTVKQLMKEAQALVKNGNYPEAIKRYDDIDAKYNSAAAKTNADILRRAIESDAASSAQLAQLESARGGLTEKAVKSSIDTLNKLPSGSVIMIMKTNSTEINMLNDVVDQITKNIVQDGKLKVVDRSSQALINAEQKFQLSGNVDDNSAISIGKQLGAKYAVLCWISGASSTRKLNIRILSIETSQITDQTNFDI